MVSDRHDSHATILQEGADPSQVLSALQDVGLTTHQEEVPHPDHQRSVTLPDAPRRLTRVWLVAQLSDDCQRFVDFAGLLSEHRHILLRTVNRCTARAHRVDFVLA